MVSFYSDITYMIINWNNIIFIKLYTLKLISTTQISKINKFQVTLI